jgi:hypothetical protein
MNCATYKLTQVKEELIKKKYNKNQEKKKNIKKDIKPSPKL